MKLFSCFDCITAPLKQYTQWFNPFPPNDVIWRHETFSFLMSHPAMSLGDRLYASRKGGPGGGGWVHPKGANSMAASGLSFEQPREMSLGFNCCSTSDKKLLTKLSDVRF